MQQPVRYYITKSGEEPTVRSVKVAQTAIVAKELSDLSESPPNGEISAPDRGAETPVQGVRGHVQEVIRKRMSAS